LVHQLVCASITDPIIENNDKVDVKKSNVIVGQYKFKIPEDLGNKIRNTLNTIDTLSRLVLPSEHQEPEEKFLQRNNAKTIKFYYSERYDNFIGSRINRGDVRRKILQAIIEEYF
jgi:hypothetical protein